MTHNDGLKINEEINTMIDNLFHKLEERKQLRVIIVDEVDRIAERERLRSEEISAQITAESSAMIAAAAINEYEAEKVDLFLGSVNCKLETQEYKPPRREELIAAIAFHYKVPDRTANEWLIKEFQRAA